MSIYRAPRSPFWQFDFQVNGYRFSGSTKCKNKRDAETFEADEKAKARQLIERAVRTGSTPLTIRRVADRWWKDHGSGLSDTSQKTDLDWIAGQLGDDTALHDITDDMVSRMVAARRLCVMPSGRTETGKQLYKPVSARTVNKTTALLRAVLRRARDNWNAVIFREPVWKNHRLKEIKRPIREISAAEETALDAAEDPDYAALRRFAIITGLRRRSLLLTWPQVDFELGVVRVQVKGGDWRVIPLTREAYALLWAQRGNHPQSVFTYVCRKSRTIPKGRQLRIAGERYPITYTGLGSHKDATWKRAGVDARIHDLRHTTGMRTLRKTGNLKAAQKLLGHADIAITARFYTDATLEDLRAAMEATSEPAAPAPAPALKDSK